MWREVSITKNTQNMFHHLALFVTDTNVYVKGILLLLILLWSEIYLFSVIHHTTHPSYLSGPVDTQQVKVHFFPIVRKKGKNLERLITATSQAHI
jgi:hypothetical protein